MAGIAIDETNPVLLTGFFAPLKHWRKWLDFAAFDSFIFAILAAVVRFQTCWRDNKDWWSNKNTILKVFNRKNGY